MEQQTTALTPKQASNIAAMQNTQAQEVLQSSISAPRIHLMQGLSEFVSEGKAHVGDIVRLPGGQILAKKGGFIDVIPLALSESWLLEEKVGDKYEYRKREARNVANDSLDWDFTHNGTPWRRSKVQEYIVLLPGDIEREIKALEAVKKGGFADPEDALVPCVLTFQRTNFNAGKEIATFFAKAKHFKSPLYYSIFRVASTTTTNTKGTYSTYTVTKGEKTPEKYHTVCATWQSMFKQGAVEVTEVAPEQDSGPAKKHTDSKEDMY